MKSKLFLSAIAMIALSASFANAAEVKSIDLPAQTLLVADSKARTGAVVPSEVMTTQAKAQAAAPERTEALAADTATTKSLNEAIAQVKTKTSGQSLTVAFRNELEKTVAEGMKTQQMAVPIRQQATELN